MVNVHAAKTQFSRLLARVEAGEEIVIARGGEPVARLVPMRRKPVRRPGALKGRVHVAADFDAPLPTEMLAAFHGGEVFPAKRSRRK
jgi:prevent-host-death family protein